MVLFDSIRKFLLRTPIYSREEKQVLKIFIFAIAGNIRVFCRVRPIPMGENFSRLISVAALDSSSLQLNFAENKNKIYSFDKVFHPGSSQGYIMHPLFR